MYTSATPTSSRCTAATCAARSTRRSAGGRSRPCAAPGTAWSAPVAELAGPAPVAAPAGARARTPLAWWRRRSLRARLTMLAALVVAGGLVAGAVLLAVSLERSLLAALDASARQRAQDVAALAGSDRLPTPLPVAGAGSVLVQVVDGEGRVLAASAGSDQAVPLLLALLAAVTWVTVGSTLRPVGALRQGAEEITGTGASRRLPLPAAHDEVHRLGVTLNRMLDRLEEAGSRQRAFVADAAHEFRSPLAGMRAQLEVALRHPDTASWRPTAESVLDDTLRLGRMVEDLLATARLDSGAAPRREVVDLGSVVRDVAVRVAAPRVPLRVDATPGVRVRGDAEGLARAVQNLLDNALRHAAGGVDVSVRAEGPLAVLAVADDGPLGREQPPPSEDRHGQPDGAAAGGFGAAGHALVDDVVADAGEREVDLEPLFLELLDRVLAGLAADVGDLHQVGALAGADLDDRALGRGGTGGRVGFHHLPGRDVGGEHPLPPHLQAGVEIGR